MGARGDLITNLLLIRQQLLNKQKELENVIHEAKQKHLALESRLLEADKKQLELQLEVERAKDTIAQERMRVKGLEGRERNLVMIRAVALGARRKKEI